LVIDRYNQSAPVGNYVVIRRFDYSFRERKIRKWPVYIVNGPFFCSNDYRATISERFVHFIGGRIKERKKIFTETIRVIRQCYENALVNGKMTISRSGVYSNTYVAAIEVLTKSVVRYSSVEFIFERYFRNISRVRKQRQFILGIFSHWRTLVTACRDVQRAITILENRMS